MKLDGIQWGTSQTDPDLYTSRISPPHVRLPIGPDYLSPSTARARQQDYPPYSSPFTIVTPYHHIRSPSCLMITNHHDISRHHHESYARNSSAFHTPSTHAFHFPLYAPIFSIAPQPAYAARQSSPCDLDR